MVLYYSFPFSSAVATSLLSKSLSLFFYSISFRSSSTDFFLFSYNSVTTYRSVLILSFLASFIFFYSITSSNFFFSLFNLLSFNLFCFSNILTSYSNLFNLVVLSSSLVPSFFFEFSSLSFYFLSSS